MLTLHDFFIPEIRKAKPAVNVSVTKIKSETKNDQNEKVFNSAYDGNGVDCV